MALLALKAIFYSASRSKKRENYAISQKRRWVLMLGKILDGLKSYFESEESKQTKNILGSYSIFGDYDEFSLIKNKINPHSFEGLKFFIKMKTDIFQKRLEFCMSRKPLNVEEMQMLVILRSTYAVASSENDWSDKNLGDELFSELLTVFRKLPIDSRSKDAMESLKLPPHLSRIHEKITNGSLYKELEKRDSELESALNNPKSVFVVEDPTEFDVFTNTRPSFTSYFTSVSMAHNHCVNNRETSNCIRSLYIVSKDDLKTKLYEITLAPHSIDRNGRYTKEKYFTKWSP